MINILFVLLVIVSSSEIESHLKPSSNQQEGLENQQEFIKIVFGILAFLCITQLIIVNEIRLGVTYRRLLKLEKCFNLTTSTELINSNHQEELVYLSGPGKSNITFTDQILNLTFDNCIKLQRFIEEYVCYTKEYTINQSTYELTKYEWRITDKSYLQCYNYVADQVVIEGYQLNQNQISNIEVKEVKLTEKEIESLMNYWNNINPKNNVYISGNYIYLSKYRYINCVGDVRISIKKAESDILSIMAMLKENSFEPYIIQDDFEQWSEQYCKFDCYWYTFCCFFTQCLFVCENPINEVNWLHLGQPKSKSQFIQKQLWIQILISVPHWFVSYLLISILVYQFLIALESYLFIDYYYNDQLVIISLLFALNYILALISIPWFYFKLQVAIGLVIFNCSIFLSYRFMIKYC